MNYGLINAILLSVKSLNLGGKILKNGIKTLAVWLILIVIFILIILIIIGVAIYFLLQKGEPPNFDHESFVTGLTYKQNQVLRFQNIKTTKIFFDFGNMSIPNQNNTLTIDVINKEKFINFESNEDIYLFKLNFKGLPIYENEIGNNTIL